MKRALARGRILPQSLSTDPRMGRVSLKANLLYDRMWTNCDDQGRISGDPDEIKYAVCPNIDQITKADIPQLLTELDSQRLIKLYNTSLIDVVQMLDWWDVQRLQWAWPSLYSPPQGWKDRLRYKKTAKEVVTENWLSPESPAESSPENTPENTPESSAENTPENTPEPSAENTPENTPESSAENTPENTPEPSAENIPKERESSKEKELKEEDEGGRRRGRGRGISPELPGENPSPSPTALALLKYFPQAFGRNPNSREVAYLRDIEKKMCAAGGATDAQVYDAYKEAANQNKLHLSYVRAVLFDWLGIKRDRSP
ncbi:hypothetical protein LCGC14_0263590 [marine sediment metagenome]|uniref:DnaD domain-containing protein n=1 Tax=marine sediment metagenome TaxID=412755 RepID=A0A0F9U645_9ZZZZ